MSTLGAPHDRLRRLQARLGRELLAEELEIERLEGAVRDLRARHRQLQEAFEEELKSIGPEGPSSPAPVSRVATEPQHSQSFHSHASSEPAPVSRTATEPQPAGDSHDEKLLGEARRFARLLVSEIALYNPLQIEEGRRHHDLYQRLKSSIDRSRQAYNQRFANTAARRFNFFHDELVRTLAADDPSLLGSDYPGPSV